MPASLGMTLVEVGRFREEILQRLLRVSGSIDGRKEAETRLATRLQAWHGVELPSGNSRFKNKFARGSAVECEVGADEAELLIIRALGLTVGAVQLTVVPIGACFATLNNGWTMKHERVYISGLSPLIDDASYILNRMRDGEGGRMFFTADDHFIDARGRQPFLSIVAMGTSPMVRKIGAPVNRQVSEACPVCFQIIPLSGVCDTC